MTLNDIICKSEKFKANINKYEKIVNEAQINDIKEFSISKKEDLRDISIDNIEKQGKFIM